MFKKGNIISARGLIVTISIALFSKTLYESDGTLDLAGLTKGLGTVWVLVDTFLVFFMQAGFGIVEAGFIRAKNTCNILTKNFLDFCMASLGFFIVGYAIIFDDGTIFVLKMPECIRIRTGDRGNKAIG